MEEEKEEGSGEESSEWEEYSDSEEEDTGPRLKPVFVRKSVPPASSRLLIPQISVCKSVILSVYVSRNSQTFHPIAFALGRYVARVPRMCTVLCEVVSMRSSYTF